MDTLLFTLAFFGTAIGIMSIGVVFKRKPIQGSCGGISALMGSCDICDKKDDCIDKIKRLSQEAADSCSTEGDCSSRKC
jgi:uncharacterized protein